MVQHVTNYTVSKNVYILDISNHKMQFVTNHLQ